MSRLWRDSLSGYAILIMKLISAAIIFYVLKTYSQLDLALFTNLVSHTIDALLVVSLIYLMVAMHAWRWYRLNLIQGIRLPLSKTIIPTYLGDAFCSVLPGSISGDFMRLYFIAKKYPDKKSSGAISILVDRVSGLIGILAIVSLMAPYYLYKFYDKPTFFFTLAVCASILPILSIILYIMLRYRNVGRIITTFIRSTVFSATFILITQALARYSNAKLVVLESILVAILCQCVFLSIICVIIKMMGLPILSLPDYMLALVLAQIASLIPLTPGGIGVGEAAFSSVLLLVSSGPTLAFATVFLAFRIVSNIAYLPGVILGIYGVCFVSVNEKSTETVELA